MTQKFIGLQGNGIYIFQKSVKSLHHLEAYKLLTERCFLIFFDLNSVDRVSLFFVLISKSFGDLKFSESCMCMLVLPFMALKSNSLKLDISSSKENFAKAKLITENLIFRWLLITYFPLLLTEVYLVIYLFYISFWESIQVPLSTLKRF